MSDFNIGLITETIIDIKKMVENYICGHCENQHKECCMRCLNCGLFKEKNPGEE